MLCSEKVKFNNSFGLVEKTTAEKIILESSLLSIS
jgi:hypothetical protein